MHSVVISCAKLNSEIHAGREDNSLHCQWVTLHCCHEKCVLISSNALHDRCVAAPSTPTENGSLPAGFSFTTWTHMILFTQRLIAPLRTRRLPNQPASFALPEPNNIISDQNRTWSSWRVDIKGVYGSAYVLHTVQISPSTSWPPVEYREAAAISAHAGAFSGVLGAGNGLHWGIVGACQRGLMKTKPGFVQ